MSRHVDTRMARGRAGSLLRGALLGGASTLAVSALAAPALAQDTEAEETTEVIVVTGIRGSLERAMDIKRNADGVVDAISAEDIGKFPDTNLAESLQRITGVSINRVNGEGSEVTVRGFGGGFNLVTLNGRTMPVANVPTIGSDQQGDFLGANLLTRSFDFSNLASEGVAGLQVYKTGRASAPTGGIGATINVTTFRPLANPGMRGSLGVKAMHDTGVESGEEITPELSGLFSWTDASERFGVSLFGSFQERDSASRSATVNGWNIERGGFFLNPANGRVRGDDPDTPEDESAEITNPPGPDQLVSFANDSRYHLAEAHRERINGQLTFQFRPTDGLTLTADATYADNQVEEARTDQTNWFNRPFDQVIFDGNPVISTAVFMQENIAGVKDMGFEQQFRATQDKLESFGFNAEWLLDDRLTLAFDAHTSEASSEPNSPTGASSTVISIGAPVITGHSVDFRSGVPVQRYVLDDCTVNDKDTPDDPTDDVQRGNCNGVLDVGDLGSQVGRTSATNQMQTVDEARFDVGWDLDRGALDFGVSYRSSGMTHGRLDTQQTLGDWGINAPGDVELFAPGLVETYCLSCLFDDYAIGQAEIAFRANAVELYQALSAAYPDKPIGPTISQLNEVQEDIFSAYAQLAMEGELWGRPAEVVAGVRYEDTQVEGTSVFTPPNAIVWQADNDLNPRVDLSEPTVTIVEEGGYSNVLPSVDFKIDLTDDLVGRVSWSKTLARPNFADLFPGESVPNNSPPRPTAIGGIPTATDGNPDLLPLVSDNFDASLEWYYGPASFVSFGVYEKRVTNFTGTGQVTRELFGLRDPSSADPGSRSGRALDTLLSNNLDPTDVNLFTLTALIEQNAGDVDAAFATFLNELNGDDFQGFVDELLTDVDIIADASDPLMQFEVTFPINSRDARIYGIEIAGQHFFGDTGFGVAGSLTTVDGDVGIDVGADPSVDQFALIGLSDTYNISAIYENYGLSARLTYNWRDEFLAQTNRGGGNRNPVFFEPFGQLDLNVTYDLTDNLQISFEGLNLLEEGVRSFGRDKSNLWFAQELDARYLVGARYRF